LRSFLTDASILKKVGLCVRDCKGANERSSAQRSEAPKRIGALKSPTPVVGKPHGFPKPMRFKRRVGHTKIL